MNFLDYQTQVRQAGRPLTEIAAPGVAGWATTTVTDPNTGAKTTSMKVIPDGPVDRANKAKERQYIDGYKRGKSQYRIIKSTVKRVRDMVEKYGAAVVGPGSLLNAIPGTPAADLAGMLETLSGSALITAMNGMRQGSAVGATGLGAMSEKEGSAVTAQGGSLVQASSPGQFLNMLDLWEDNADAHSALQGDDLAELNRSVYGKGWKPRNAPAAPATAPATVTALPQATESTPPPTPAVPPVTPEGKTAKEISNEEFAALPEGTQQAMLAQAETDERDEVATASPVPVDRAQEVVAPIPRGQSVFGSLFGATPAGAAEAAYRQSRSRHPCKDLTT